MPICNRCAKRFWGGDGIWDGGTIAVCGECRRLGDIPELEPAEFGTLTVATDPAPKILAPDGAIDAASPLADPVQEVRDGPLTGVVDDLPDA